MMIEDIIRWLFIFVFCSPILLGLPIYLLVVITRIMKSWYARRYQAKFFCELVKGDRVWKLDDNKIVEYVVTYVKYCFNNDNIVKTMDIGLLPMDDGYSYETLFIRPDQAKSWKYHDYYCNYAECNMIVYTRNLQRKKSINDMQPTREDVLKDRERIKELYEKLKQETIDRTKLEI